MKMHNYFALSCRHSYVLADLETILPLLHFFILCSIFQGNDKNIEIKENLFGIFHCPVIPLNYVNLALTMLYKLDMIVHRHLYLHVVLLTLP